MFRSSTNYFAVFWLRPFFFVFVSSIVSFFVCVGGALSSRFVYLLVLCAILLESGSQVRTSWKHLNNGALSLLFVNLFIWRVAVKCQLSGATWAKLWAGLNQICDLAL